MQTLTLPYRPRVAGSLGTTANPPITANIATLPSAKDLTTVLEQDSELNKLPSNPINIASIIENSQPKIDALNKQLSTALRSNDGANAAGSASSTNGTALIEPDQTRGGECTGIADAMISAEGSNEKGSVATTSLPVGMDADRAPQALDERSGFGTAGHSELKSGKGKCASRLECARGKAAKVVSLLGCFAGDRLRKGERKGSLVVTDGESM